LKKLLVHEFKYSPQDVNIIDEKGFCPLQLAIENKNMEFVNYLLEK
jgi:ankyrin repeat protein